MTLKKALFTFAFALALAPWSSSLASVGNTSSCQTRNSAPMNFTNIAKASAPSGQQSGPRGVHEAHSRTNASRRPNRG